MLRFVIIITALICLDRIYAQEITGDWYGVLEGVDLRINFHIKEKDSLYSATIDSPDQGAYGLYVDSISITDSILEISMLNMGAYYKGVFSDESENIDGQFEQNGKKLKLILKRNRVEKRKKFNNINIFYKEENISFRNQKDSIILAGTLTIPKEKGIYPAVILISGSGPHNRDCELKNHKPFLVIADFLTRHGFAVLRYDDRGVEESTGEFSTATTNDLANDVLCAIAYLKSRNDIDKSKIGLIGHSEGGLISSIVASESDDVSFIIMLAGPGIPGDEIILLQNILIGLVDGVDQDRLVKLNELYGAAFEILKEESSIEEAKAKVREEVKNIVEEFKFPDDSISFLDDNQIEYFTNEVCTPWLKYFISFNPFTALEKVKCPVLSLIGTKDLQVPAEINQKAIREALERGGNLNFRIKTMPGLNHIFQECNTGSPSEYSRIKQTISPEVLKEILIWILQKTN